ncbi:thiaminase II [Natronoarchaeum philippinense]|nr:thiaminase II [Natronoarchaeum philippinense]
MPFSEELLADGEQIWQAQYDHPFVRELAEGTLDPAAFETWVRQDYRYLLDYARTHAIAGTKAREESTMAHLLGVAERILNEEMDLHREFAAEYGLAPEDLEATAKAPTCVAYTNFLVRTAHEGSLAEIAAAIYPCAQGYLDVAERMAEIQGDADHRYTPFIEKYTSDAFRDAVTQTRELVDRCGEQFPGERDAMREAFLTSARLEHDFWEMAYTTEEWAV